MKFLLFLSIFLFCSVSVNAEQLSEIDVDCWHQGVDEGSFYCQFVMVMGRRASDNSLFIPDLAAPDQGGAKTQEQADRACQAMGFLYAIRYELEPSKGEGMQATLSSSGKTGYLAPVRDRIIQHVSCE